ncbi:TonB-dependent receptor [Congregibacter variabilis]|uniref:TonB-dependent receptor n=1 Tax=Congregibacter variabilis TaxID=3081200 RepID=A0ABZ0I4H0_9GAMM|nr:TonB-dependent receptor [Congregibacter sp. IMCC43200]
MRLFTARILRPLLGISALVFTTASMAQDDGAAASRIEQVIVSASREPEMGLNLALPWSRIDDEALKLTGAVHINQIMQRTPGAWISRGNGQESLTALRSPVLTGSGGCGAFYTAWDGISLRAPGFCNVNQLFDVNSEQAGAIEVIRGPGTAVYGANAVHGVINTITADPRRGPQNAFAIEAGPNDYYRVRGEFRAEHGEHAFGAYFNGASDGGYKDNSGFDQQKLTLRHDFKGDVWQVRNALEATNLNQETSGFVAGFEAYKDPAQRPANPNPEAYRDSFALRAYSQWERETNAGQISITPYFRRTTMEFLQHFLPWQPVEKNGQESLGLRVSLNDGSENFNWSTGIDIDVTRGWLSEVQADAFSPNQPAGVHYDYEVDAVSAAIYGQANWQLSSRIGLAAGLRLEQNSYDYNNQTGDGSACAPEASACRFFRPADREDDFGNGSLNLGVTYALSDAHRVYLRGAQGFRPPQAAELYRLQSGQENADLDSETISSIDLGLRGEIAGFSYDTSVYSMLKRDVIFQNADRQNVSGAKTSHEGIEFSVYWTGESGWYAGVDGNIARHKYDGDANLLGSRLDIQGNDIDTAPRQFGSARLGLDKPLQNNRSLRTELEWVHMGSYYLEPDNQHEYEGHDLLNLRMALSLGKGFSTTLRVTNLLDEEYAERADFGFGSYRYFVGEPRGVFVEFAYSPK